MVGEKQRVASLFGTSAGDDGCLRQRNGCKIDARAAISVHDRLEIPFDGLDGKVNALSTPRQDLHGLAGSIGAELRAHGWMHGHCVPEGFHNGLGIQSPVKRQRSLCNVGTGCCHLRLEPDSALQHAQRSAAS